MADTMPPKSGGAGPPERALVKRPSVKNVRRFARHLLPWTERAFIDEASERLLLGQVIAHPDRFAELRVGIECFHGSRAVVFRIIARRASAGLPIDLFSSWNDLFAELVLSVAVDCWAEWLDAPIALGELQGALRDRLRRREVNVLGEQLIDAARSPSLPDCELLARVGHVVTALGRIRDAAESRSGSHSMMELA